MKKQVALLIISALLILLFIYASFSKLLRYGMFKYQLHNQVFPHWTVPILAWAIPVSEIIIAICLMSDKTRRKGLYWSLVLMALFTGYIALVLTNIFGRIPCSCGGILQKMGWGQHLIFNIFFLALAIIGVIIDRRQRSENAIYDRKNMLAA